MRFHMQASLDPLLYFNIRVLPPPLPRLRSVHRDSLIAHRNFFPVEGP